MKESWRWADNIKMDLKEIGVDELAQDGDHRMALVNMALKLQVT
jgi:hypothetical protein